MQPAPSHAISVPWAVLVFVAAACVPWLGSRFYTFLATDIAILALFAVSLNLLLGTTGLVSFGHAAYFGIGAYTCAILMKTYGVPFAPALVAAGVNAAFWALLFGAFCVRSTQDLFLACSRSPSRRSSGRCASSGTAVTGGEQGLQQRALSGPRLDGRDPGARRACASATDIYLLVLLLIGVALRAPAAHRRLAVRTHAHGDPRKIPSAPNSSASNVRRYQLAAFVVAGAFAGIAGALFGVFNRGVFPDFAYWAKSAEVLIMVILGGMGQLLGPGGRRRAR